jgi:hypothetical protein
MNQRFISGRDRIFPMPFRSTLEAQPICHPIGTGGRREVFSWAEIGPDSPSSCNRVKNEISEVSHLPSLYLFKHRGIDV